MHLKQIGEHTYEGRKICTVDGIKAVESDGKFYLSGYANTKDKPDSYGDIPHSLNGSPVYDLSRFQKNPVMLVDHCMSVGSIMGTFVELREDQIGLYFRALIMDLSDAYTETVQHAISAYRRGFAKALSIGGIWEFNDPENRSHLTTAKIFEISGVAVGADENAIVTPQPQKSTTEIEKP